MSPEIKLSRLKQGQSGVIAGLNGATVSSSRLIELGFCPGCAVKPLFSALGGGLTAYLIMNSVIALRPSDAAKISVKPH